MAVSKFTSAAGGNDFNVNVGSTYSVVNFTQEYAPGAYSFTSAQLDVTMDVYAYNGLGALVGYTNGKGLITSGGFNKLVIIGGTPNDVLSFSYKTTYSSVAETAEVTSGPVILSVTPTSLPNVNSSTTVTGLNFATDITASFTGSDSLVRPAKSLVRGSATSLVVTRPDTLPTAYSPYTLTVTNPSVSYQPTGSAANTILVTAGVVPIWQTATSQPINFATSTSTAQSLTFSATDADGGSSVTYSLVSGAFPTGASFNTSTGVLSNIANSNIGNSYTYTLRATDSGGNTADRAFTTNVQLYISGGTQTSDATYYYNTLTANGNIVNNTASPISIDYLVVAGGAAGGSGLAGGGGAGGYRASTASLAAATTYAVTVGGGGAGTTANQSRGASGGNSSLIGGAISISATGGGGGGNYADVAGNSGGSGGGGGGTGSVGTYNNGGSGNVGSYNPVEGYSGGRGTYWGNSQHYGGGGGGAGGGGSDTPNSNIGGDGGPGLNWQSLGTYYAAGGGGCGRKMNSGAGGYGGSSGAGGRGAGTNGSAGNGTTPGSGGGGGDWVDAGSDQKGGNGANGVVIVRYTRASVGG
jgi:hypothetical protein